MFAVVRQFLQAAALALATASFCACNEADKAQLAGPDIRQQIAANGRELALAEAEGREMDEEIARLKRGALLIDLAEHDSSNCTRLLWKARGVLEEIVLDGGLSRYAVLELARVAELEGSDTDAAEIYRDTIAEIMDELQFPEGMNPAKRKRLDGLLKQVRTRLKGVLAKR